MRRAFPILASIAGLLLVSSLVLDLVGSPNQLAWASIAVTLAVHGSVFAYLRATGRDVEAVAGRLGLPGWVGAQAEKNRRKAFVYEAWGSSLVVLAGCSSGGGWWHLVLSASCLSFQLGAFVGEFAILAAQARLLGDVEPRADSSRLASDLLMRP
jgi:hypothetical protein